MGLVTDAKAGQVALGSFFALFELVDSGMAGAVLAEFQQLLDGSIGAFDENFYAAVREIAHPATQITDHAGTFSCTLAKKHALDAACNPEMQAFYRHLGKGLQSGMTCLYWRE